MKLRKIKAQELALANAPLIVLIVGLTFLILATIALVSEKYQDALPVGETSSTVNETNSINMTETTPMVFTASGQCNAQTFAVSICTNTSDAVIGAGNYTVSGAGTLSVTADVEPTGVNNTVWQCSYTNKFSGVTCNITNDLNTEIANNTSIAGIILTISLVGIVLAVLVGVFIGVRKGI